jgi:DNA-binding MarR family transcriptional regulator
MDTDPKTQEVARAVLEIIPLTMRTVSAAMRRVGHDLFPGHMRVLGMCSKRVWTLRELAEAQGVSPPTMSSTVNVLVTRGWLTRTPSEQDRREVQIDLTPQGQEVLEEAQRKVQAHVAALLVRLSPGELETVLAGLVILRDAFQADIDAENR